MDTLVFLVAHPDDVAFGMGGTVWRLRERYQLHVLCATRGERGIHGTGPAETAAIRTREQQAACDRLGAELTFLDRIDRELFADRKATDQVATLLRTLQPRALFTPWPLDAHPDHSAVSELAKKALFCTGLEPELYFCEENMRGQTSQFRPDLYVDVSAVMDRKIELLRCHPSQNPADRMVADALQQAQFRGWEAGCAAAEGFKTVRPLDVQKASVLLSLE